MVVAWCAFLWIFCIEINIKNANILLLINLTPGNTWRAQYTGCHAKLRYQMYAKLTWTHETVLHNASNRTLSKLQILRASVHERSVTAWFVNPTLSTWRGWYCTHFDRKAATKLTEIVPVIGGLGVRSNTELMLISVGIDQGYLTYQNIYAFKA